MHVSSVFLLSLRVCERYWPLRIGPHQFLNSSLYLSPWTIQYFYSLDQLKKFILASKYFPDQGTKDPYSSLHNTLHKWASIFSPNHSTFYDHFTKTLVDIDPSRAWLLIVSPSEAEPSIFVYSFLSSSEKKPQSGWISLKEKHSSKSWSSCPWS